LIYQSSAWSKTVDILILYELKLIEYLKKRAGGDIPALFLRDKKAARFLSKDAFLSPAAVFV
jgi:hypothetical protein